ncbi:MAG: polysaccharide deacetylase family protein [Deltaproteobacteria bacterium]|nr:polysaccharide deacetylase family protein [Deltaproteobacteria bacterium]MBW2258278.1 polysaccharide deacetylase family protein [Deltaproteobacteria bacterium]
MSGVAGGYAVVATATLGLHLLGALPTGAATVVGLVLAGALVGTLVVASSRIDLQLYGPAVVRGPTNNPVVALTFDDGPHPDSTPALLRALRHAEARATFFVLVDQCERHPDLLRAIAAEHEVGLHGLAHHPWLTLLPPGRGAAELREAVRRLRSIVDAEIRWYRPAFGVTSPRLAEAVERAGLRTAWCSLRTGDGVRSDPGRLLTACARAEAGDVLLLHEGPKPARLVLPQVLRDLADRDLRSVSIGDLLA